MKVQILTTLAYADIFDYPLTEKEIWQWLIQKSKRVKEQESRKKFKEALSRLLKEKGGGKKREFYFLPGREKIVGIRKQREGWSKEKIKIAEKTVAILRFIPWIKLVGITGGLAMKNSDKDDDIDLFFITSKDRVWLTRGIIVLILLFLGVYRRPNKRANMICPNMFVAEDRLKMEPEDLFIAHEVCQLKPVFEKDNNYSKFLADNLWVRDFLPNALRTTDNKQQTTKKGKKFSNHQLSIINLAEHLAKTAQLWYMAKKRTTEVVSESLIKFHPQDARSWVLKEYQERLQKLQIS